MIMPIKELCFFFISPQKKIKITSATTSSVFCHILFNLTSTRIQRIDSTIVYGLVHKETHKSFLYLLKGFFWLNFFAQIGF
jgi:hypothetical protein